MSCPTCGCEMRVFAAFDASGKPIPPRVLHCPRCGTQVIKHATPVVTVPILVERCRRFEAFLKTTVSDVLLDVWQSDGIAEAINLPENRPQ